MVLQSAGVETKRGEAVQRYLLRQGHSAVSQPEDSTHARFTAKTKSNVGVQMNTDKFLAHRERTLSPALASLAARVRAATALMDRAGLTVEVRHKADHAQQQAAQPQLEDAERMAREILQSLPTVMAVLPADEVEAVLSDLPRMT